MYWGDMYYENITSEEEAQLEYFNDVEELPQITPEELTKLPEDELQDIFKDDLNSDEDAIA